MPYRPDNDAQRELDQLHAETGGMVIAMRVDWAKRLKSIHAALILQQLIFKGRHHADHDGWFYVTADDMEDQTAVGERGYADARKKLVTLGLIDAVRRGVPPRVWIRIDVAAVLAWSDEGSVLRRRDRFRHMQESIPTDGGNNSATPRARSRQRAEPIYESAKETENESMVARSRTRKIDPPQPKPPIWQRLDPVADRGTILRNRIERPEPPSITDVGGDVELVHAWIAVQRDWDAGRRR